MKYFFIFFLLGFFVFKAFAQPSVDVGVFGGVGGYIGDMTKVDFQKSINPVYGGFIRYNFNPRYALRFNFLNGNIGAYGSADYYKWVSIGKNSNGTDILDRKIVSVPSNFKKNVLDVSLNFEWNYLKYIVGDRETKWTTFIFGGVGLQGFKFNIDSLKLYDVPSNLNTKTHSELIVAPDIAFGLGFKYNLSKRWGIGVEGGIRKSFSDKLDDLDDPLSYIDKNVTPEVQVKYTDQLHNNDWTTYVGVHLVYKLIYGNQNWEVKTPKSNILDWGIMNKIRK